jgi:hypothetical protein
MQISSDTGIEITIDSYSGLLSKYKDNSEIEVEMAQYYMQYQSWDSKSDFYLFDP